MRQTYKWRECKEKQDKVPVFEQLIPVGETKK